MGKYTDLSLTVPKPHFEEEIAVFKCKLRGGKDVFVTYTHTPTVIPLRSLCKNNFEYSGWTHGLRVSV